jgi:hypothetical protein
VLWAEASRARFTHSLDELGKAAVGFGIGRIQAFRTPPGPDDFHGIAVQRNADADATLLSPCRNGHADEAA